MATVASEIQVAVSLAEAWDYYFDERGWPDWVDQFASVVSSDGYPEAGGTLRWRSGRAGRGEVTERVLEHQPRKLHRIAFSDPESEGELTVLMEAAGDGTRIGQELTYQLLRGGPFVRAADVLFVRSQMRTSLSRSLLALRAELEGR